MPRDSLLATTTHDQGRQVRQKLRSDWLKAAVSFVPAEFDHTPQLPASDVNNTVGTVPISSRTCYIDYTTMSLIDKVPGDDKLFIGGYARFPTLPP